MKTKPSAAAMRAAYAYCDPNNSRNGLRLYDEAFQQCIEIQATKLAAIIDAEYRGLVEAAERLLVHASNIPDKHNTARMLDATECLRTELDKFTPARS